MVSGTMEMAARAQAADRADREGVACLVYRKPVPEQQPPTYSVMWFVRAESEEPPEGAELVDRIEPWRKG